MEVCVLLFWTGLAKGQESGEYCYHLPNGHSVTERKSRVQVFELTQARKKFTASRAYRTELKIVQNNFWDSVALSGQYLILLTADCVYCVDWQKRHEVGLVRVSTDLKSKFE